MGSAIGCISGGVEWNVPSSAKPFTVGSLEAEPSKKRGSWSHLCVALRGLRRNFELLSHAQFVFHKFCL